jgi:hypothetical protein
MPALGDMPCADGLKACCEILRRISIKAAELSATNLRDQIVQLELLPEDEEAA